MARLGHSAGWFALAAALVACSHKDRCAEVEVDVVGEPDHVAKVSPEAVKRRAAATFRAHGSAHDHVFSLTGEDMHQLELGKTVNVRTSSTNAHVHDMTVRCKN
jgi:hypothetical protein